MRAARLVLIAVASFGPLHPAAAHETPADPALHCAALAQITGDLLGAAGELADEDRAALEQAIDLMLSHSPLGPGETRRALKAHVNDLRAHHSASEIAEEIDQKSDACVEKYVG